MTRDDALKMKRYSALLTFLCLASSLLVTGCGGPSSSLSRQQLLQTLASVQKATTAFNGKAVIKIPAVHGNYFPANYFDNARQFFTQQGENVIANHHQATYNPTTKCWIVTPYQQADQTTGQLLIEFLVGTEPYERTLPQLASKATMIRQTQTASVEVLHWQDLLLVPNDADGGLLGVGLPGEVSMIENITLKYRLSNHQLVFLSGNLPGVTEAGIYPSKRSIPTLAQLKPRCHNTQSP
jgi:hypothetical protein